MAAVPPGPFNPTTVNVGKETGPAAAVTIGEVPVTSQDALFRNVNAGVPADYKVTSRFERDGRVWMLPLTSTQPFQGASVAFVTLASPTLLWIADWTASQAGQRPILPNPNLMLNNLAVGAVGGSIAGTVVQNWVLLDTMIEPASMSIMADGVTVLYRISGVYVYGCRNPNQTPVLGARYPSPPWLNVPPQAVQGGDFQQGIL